MAVGQEPELSRLLPFFSGADDGLKREFISSNKRITVPPGQNIIWEGQECRHLAILDTGMVRVYKVGENGREITLYRFGPGESCILTVSCIVSENTFPAIACAENEVSAYLVPSNIVRKWIDDYPEWREYVLRFLAKRISGVINKVEDIAFRRMDSRIADLLLKRAAVSPILKITHQEIASELGSVREVISRILKEFEQKEIITLQRGLIQIENMRLLKKITGII